MDNVDISSWDTWTAFLPEPISFQGISDFYKGHFEVLNIKKKMFAGWEMIDSSRCVLSWLWVGMIKHKHDTHRMGNWIEIVAHRCFSCFQ